MSVLPIVKWPDPRLSTPCAPVAGGDVRELAADMLETMYAAPGRGLAGPQVGAMIRLFVMDAGWKEGTPTPLVMLDPEIVEASEEVVAMDEGCLSIPGVTTTVTRPVRVRLRWTDLEGVAHDEWMEGASARIAQHEYDHLDGIVTFDRLDPPARSVAEAEYAG